MKVKSGAFWLVKDSKGKKILGRHTSEKKADAQLAAIHASQKRQRSKKK